MKKFFAFIVSLLLIIDISTFASAFHIAVPKNLVEKNAMLLVYMLDSEGNQSVGKCQLDSDVASRVIMQNQLELTSSADIALMQTGVDLMQNNLTLEPQAVVVCFELDSAVQLVRILVVKESFFDTDPFDIEEVSFDSVGFELEKENLEYDELSSLTQALSEQSAAQLAQRNNVDAAWFDQYMAYAKIFVLMQYNNAQRVARDMSAWLK